MQILSLGGEDLLQEELATHSAIQAGISPRTEELDRLQSTGSQSQTEQLITHTFSTDCMAVSVHGDHQEGLLEQGSKGPPPQFLIDRIGARLRPHFLMAPQVMPILLLWEALFETWGFTSVPWASKDLRIFTARAT